MRNLLRIILLSFLLRQRFLFFLFIEFVYYMQQCISVDAPVERLHNACGADFSVRTGQIAG